MHAPVEELEDRRTKSSTIAINVSGAQLADPAFVRLIAATLNRQNPAPSIFDLQLTEGLLIEASPQIFASLNVLRNMGFNVVIDDFASGHVSFR